MQTITAKIINFLYIFEIIKKPSLILLLFLSEKRNAATD